MGLSALHSINHPLSAGGGDIFQSQILSPVRTEGVPCQERPCELKFSLESLVSNIYV